MATSTLDLILRSRREGSTDIKETADGLAEVESRATSLGKALKQDAAGALGVFGVNLEALNSPLTLLAQGIKSSIDAAQEQERIMSQTEAVIKSTGGAAGLTAKQVSDMAGAMSQMSSVDDEVVQSGQNMLLTFTNIGQETFPQATQAMLDMAIAMNKGQTANLDLQGTAMQLGKALNDPVAGITALTRAGVTFSEEQKAMIKQMVESGDVVGAQSIILKEVNKEFGGQAEAAGNTTAGKMEKVKNEIGNLAAAIGEKLLPILSDMLTRALEFLDTLQKGVEVFSLTFGGGGSTSLGSAFEATAAQLQQQVSSGQMSQSDYLNALRGMADNIAQWDQGLAMALRAKYGLAMGGNMAAGVPVLVGERGPEVIVPSSGGRVIPNSQISNFNLTVNNAGQNANIMRDFSMMRALARA